MKIPAYIFDCSDIETLEQFWDRYLDVVQGPGSERFGRNFAALNAALAGGPGAPELPCVFVFTQHDQLRRALGYTAEQERLQAELAKAPAGPDRERLQQRLADAKQQVGPTPFSRLINTIQDHLRIRLVLH